MTNRLDPMAGKKGFAPVVHKVGGKETFILGRVTYGVMGYEPILENQFKTFPEAEDEAEKLNRRNFLSDEEAWLLIENTVMCDR